jgi:hypothetical protein
MISALFFSQLVLVALVWLCLMLQWAWPSVTAKAYCASGWHIRPSGTADVCVGIYA